MKPDDVFDFWFGTEGSPERGQERKAWFEKNDAFDRLIEHRFGPLIEAMLAGAYADWMEGGPQSAVARVIVLDQFTRNVFRGTPRAFAGDALALAAARQMVATAQDDALRPEQRVFVYLPFEHAEDLAAQRESMRLYTRLGHAENLRYAKAHHDIIERFGRFPHRNAILGRVSTPQEIEFLKQPGSSF